VREEIVTKLRWERMKESNNCPQTQLHKELSIISEQYKPQEYNNIPIA